MRINHTMHYRNEVVVLFLSSFCTKIEQGVSGSEMQIDLFDFNNLEKGCVMYMTRVRVVASLMQKNTLRQLSQARREAGTQVSCVKTVCMSSQPMVAWFLSVMTCKPVKIKVPSNQFNLGNLGVFRLCRYNNNSKFMELDTLS